MKFRQSYNIKDSGVSYIWALLIPQLVIIIFSAIAANIAVSAGLTEEQVNTNVVIICLSLLVSQLCFAGVFLIYSRVKRINFVTASKVRFKFNIWKLLIVIAVAAGLLFGFNQFISLVDFCIVKTTGINGSALSLNINNFGVFVLAVLLYALIPAVVEEFLFRGLIYNGIRSKYSEKKAILISALMFMLIHMSINQSIYQFVLGVVLCLIVYFTGSIFYSMVAHFVNNFLIVLVTYIQTSRGIESVTKMSWSAWEVVIAIAIMLATVALITTIFYLWYKKAPPAKEEKAVVTVDDKVKAAEGLGEYELRAMNPSTISPKAWLWIGVGVGGLLWIVSLFM